MSQYTDINYVCMCGDPFVWTAGEQRFMNELASKGKISSVIPPKRCIPCRNKKKERMKKWTSK